MLNKSINSFIFLLLFSSCINNQNKERIFQLERENDSLKDIIVKYNESFKDKIFMIYSNNDNKQIGTLSEYAKPLPEYYLIKKNKEKVDTLVNKGTEAFIRLSENNEIYNNPLVSYELHLKHLGIIYDARKLN